MLVDDFDIEISICRMNNTLILLSSRAKPCHRFISDDSDLFFALSLSLYIFWMMEKDENNLSGKADKNSIPIVLDRLVWNQWVKQLVKHTANEFISKIVFQV